MLATDPYHHMPTLAEPYSATFAGEIRLPIDRVARCHLNERKLIGHRADLELLAGNVVYLGIGIPEAVAAVATEE